MRTVHQCFVQIMSLSCGAVALPAAATCCSHSFAICRRNLSEAWEPSTRLVLNRGDRTRPRLFPHSPPPPCLPGWETLELVGCHCSQLCLSRKYWDLEKEVQVGPAVSSILACVSMWWISMKCQRVATRDKFL